MRLGLRPRLPQYRRARPGPVISILAFRERSEIGEQCDSDVVLGGLPAGDERFDAQPGGIFLERQLVQTTRAGQGT